MTNEEREKEELREKSTKELIVELVIVNKESNHIQKTHFRWLLVAIIIMALGSKGVDLYEKITGKAVAEEHEG